MSQSVKGDAVQVERLKIVRDGEAARKQIRPAELNSKWLARGGAALEPLLAHTTLLCARYVLALAKSHGTLPPWQALPPDATCTERERQLARLSAGEYIAMRKAGEVSCEEYAVALTKRWSHYSCAAPIAPPRPLSCCQTMMDPHPACCGQT